MSDEGEIDLNFDKVAPVKCKHCGKERNRHRAGACPLGRGNFPSYRKDQFFEPRETCKSKK